MALTKVSRGLLSTSIVDNGNATAITIDSSENVGIGRSPRVGLDVAGEVAIAYDASYGLRFYNQPQNNWAFIGNDSTNSAADLRLGDSTGEVMRLSGGNLFVGSTAYEGSTTSNASSAYIAASGFISANVTNDFGMQVNRTGTDGKVVNFRKNGADVGSINAQQSSLSIGGSSTGAIYFNAGTDVRPWNKTANTNADNTLFLGAPNSRWEEFFCANSTINPSDRNEKQDIEELSDAEQRVAVAAKGLLRKYRWRDAVAEKGDDARIHFGIIAQDLQDAFTAEGLDARRYAMFCSDTWTNDDGSEQTRLGVRYSELLAFIISAI